MDSTAVLDLFRRCAGLLEGHFQLSSGLHSGGYLQCARVLQHPAHAAALGQALAAQAAWARGGGLVELPLSTTTAAMLG